MKTAMRFTQGRIAAMSVAESMLHCDI